MLDRVNRMSHSGSIARAAHPASLQYASRAAPPRLMSSPGVTWTAKSDARYADVKLDAAITSADRLLLNRLVGPSVSDPSNSMLHEVTNGGWDKNAQPDFLAVRSGSGVSAEFSGGGNVTAWTNGSTGTTVYYFGGGAAPDAFKGVAISFGLDATPGDRDNERILAMGFLAQHIDDHQLAGGVWNRPLIDALL